MFSAPPVAPAPPAPLLISLPHGLDLGGVTTWAVRLANGLAALGRAVALVVHPSDDTQPPAKTSLHPSILLVRPPHWPTIKACAGDLSPFIPIYRDTIRELIRRHTRTFGAPSPVVFAPNILAESYAIAAALCLVEPESLRVLAWQHTDSDYDWAVLDRYQAIAARLVAIDGRCAERLIKRLPARNGPGEVVSIPHGVPVPSAPPSPREPLTLPATPGASASTNGHTHNGSSSTPAAPASLRFARPLRLLYTGRIEHRQKRITALAYLSDELAARGIPHQIAALGDGPAAADFDALCATRPHVRRHASVPHEAVDAWLRRADAFVLPSRYEGLCISRIEAMAAGCVPILTTSDGGASAGLRDGQSALFADARRDDAEPAVARALTEAVMRFLQADQYALARVAWAAAREHFALEHHLARCAAVIDNAASSPPRSWRADVPCAVSNAPATPAAGAGWAPPDAPDRLRRALDALAGRTILLHGAGRHTIDLAAVLARAPLTIAGLTDDDPQQHGRTLFGWTILDPARAAASGATDVIISSYIHREAIWSRRAVYERQGIRVHALYA